MNKPITLAEAQKYTYGAGSYCRVPYYPDRCAAEVWSHDRWPRPYQCRRKLGHGPDGLYCKMHARDFAESDAVTQQWYCLECDERVSVVEVTRSTPSRIWIKKGDKQVSEARHSDYRQYFPDKAGVQAQLQLKLEQVRRALTRAEEETANALKALEELP